MERERDWEGRFNDGGLVMVMKEEMVETFHGGGFHLSHVFQLSHQHLYSLPLSIRYYSIFLFFSVGSTLYFLERDEEDGELRRCGLMGNNKK